MEEHQDSLFVKLIPFFEKYGILLLILIMIAVLHLLQPDVFLSWRNITNIFKQISWQSLRRIFRFKSTSEYYEMSINGRLFTFQILSSQKYSTDFKHLCTFFQICQN